jgi:hypothetical protein
MNFTQHPLSQAFPSMNEENFQALKDDIEVNGQREPVMIFENMVLDGWHRYRACIDLGIKPTQFNFAPEDDPVVFVMSQNLHRRHLTAPQRAAAVIACSSWHPPHRQKKVEAASTLPKTDTQKKQGTSAPLIEKESKTNAEMAKEAKVSVHTIKDVKAAQKAGLIDAVIDGALTAKEAGKIARGTPAKKPATTVATPKPALVVVPATVIKPEDAYTELDAAQDQIHDLQSMLAVANLGTVSEEDKDQAKNLIAELRAEIKKLTAMNKALTVSRDSFQNKAAELQKQINRQRREIDHVTGRKTA